jgi:hypothetical protein
MARLLGAYSERRLSSGKSSMAPQVAPQRRNVMDHLMDALFNLTLQVRYVAVYRHGELTLRQRPDLTGASAPESDRYEELLVNPTILTLT